ncbi:HAMP domain-containing protein [Pseudoalteromonas tunicata]|uniref:HAMP domain-containing protein n=1 Tax=Pseudoalteromonas tunicata TaxID=314281 RepID=UPI00273DE8C0|nr:HAMP domain-containing protein [Pseudoalteromonas tunicata]MDP4984286.1 HAMP domain-containing protein [Pseudoalteromonas tunicata]MDP5214972.1 HAMP domain-containing protein [Pseudoalteromonas tunicata]
MRISFAVKLGVLMIVLMTALVGSILIYFYQYSVATLNNDLKQAIGDVTRTASFVFKEEEREQIMQLRNKLNSTLSDDFALKVRSFSQLEEGSTELLLSQEQSKALEGTLDFQYLVQLLRRIQEGSRNRVNALGLLPQTNILATNASRAAWAYLLVRVPNTQAKDALMFLADSNYQKDDFSTEGNPIGNMYRPPAFFTAPFTQGVMGIADNWYTDEFGTVMTALVPIKAENGEVIAVLGIDYDVASFQNRIEKQKQISWSVFGVSLIVALTIALVIAGWISLPLSKLRSGAEQLSRQDFAYRVRIKSHDEFGVLANTFNQVSEKLGQFTSNLEAIVDERTAQLTKANEKVIELNKRLSEENEYLGAEVDNLLELRKKYMPYINSRVKIGEFELSLNYLPSRNIAGDFWQILPQGQLQPALYFGQVSGGGLETASLTLQLQSLLQYQIGDTQDKLAASNHMVLQQSKILNCDFLVKMLAIEFDNHNLKIVGQCQDPILFNKKRCTEISITQDNFVLGLNHHLDLKAIDCTPQLDDVLLVYSSGFRQALLKLSNHKQDFATCSDLIAASGLQQHSPQELLEKFRSEIWFNDFPSDISFIQIKRINV